jgi:hypothetical protein
VILSEEAGGLSTPLVLSGEGSSGHRSIVVLWCTATRYSYKENRLLEKFRLDGNVGSVAFEEILQAVNALQSITMKSDDEQMA